MREAALVLIVVGVIVGPLVAWFNVPVAMKLQKWAARVVGPDASKTRLRVVGVGPPFVVTVAYIAFMILALR